MSDDRPTTDLLAEVALMYRRLRTADDPMQMLATAADLVGSSMSLSTCLSFTVTPDGLATRGTHPLASPASEQLRRRALGLAVPLAPGTQEHELLRRPMAVGEPRTRALSSAVGIALGLERLAVAPIAPDVRAVAFLVGTREGGMDDPQRSLFATYGHAIAAALDLVVMRMRASEVITEARRAATSIQALGREMTSASVVLPLDSGFGLTFPVAPEPAAVGRNAWAEVLTTKEISIAELLVEGRSNRDIATTLVLSPETVKSHVSSILKKLGVGNRAEAVARLMRIGERKAG